MEPIEKNKIINMSVRKNQCSLIVNMIKKKSESSSNNFKDININNSSNKSKEKNVNEIKKNNSNNSNKQDLQKN